MAEITLKNGEVALVDDADLKRVMSFSFYWYLSNGYAVTRKHQRSIFMHAVVNNTPVGMCTDHINRNRLDNRKSNLRSCTRSENSHRIRCVDEKVETEIASQYAAGDTAENVAKRYGVKKQTVYRIGKRNGIVKHRVKYNNVSEGVKRRIETMLKNHINPRVIAYKTNLNLMTVYKTISNINNQ